MDRDLINELKNIVGDSARDIIIGAYSIQKKGNGYLCPLHQDKNPSMGWNNKNNHFHCFVCGKQIDIYNYFTDIEKMEYIDIMKKYNLIDELGNTLYKHKKQEIKQKVNINDDNTNNLNDIKFNELSSEAIDYFDKRKIDINTLANFDIKLYNSKIAFIYKKNDNIIGAKLRTIGKCEKHLRFSAIQGSGNKNFWNQSNVNLDNDVLIISEGEADAMILYQCGYTNVISIPDGVNSSKRVIDEEIEFLDKFNSIILVSDNDEAGSNMDKIFIDKLGHKVKLIDKSLMKTKDINEEYYRHGKEKISIIMNSAELKIKGYKNATVSKYTGMVNDGIKFIHSGIDSLDYEINTLQSKNVTLVTGKTSHGKTVFVSMVQNNAIDKGFKVLRVDGEHAYMHILNNTYQKIIAGNRSYYDLVEFGIRNIIEPKKHILEALQEWHENKLHLYVKGDSCLNSTEELFEQIKYIIQVEKIDLIILDNLMSLLDSSSSKDRNEKQGEFMKKCHNLAIACNVHIILVAHPKKPTDSSKNSTNGILDAYQISGTSDLPNLADNIVSIEKIDDEELLRQGIHGRIHLLKNRHYGTLKTVDVFFDKQTTLFVEINDSTEELKHKKLSWEKYLKSNICNEVKSEFDSCPF